MFSKRKTIKQWAKKLPIPIRRKFLANVPPDHQEIRVHCLYVALRGGFFWDTSPEGFDYWEKVANAHRNPQIPLLQRLINKLKRNK
jgi:hypothetical protein